MSLPASYFDDLYRRASDPWSLETRWYEARKYALTIASLPKARFRRAFEAGCSVGVLTNMLAERCDELVAADISATAVEATSSRVADHPGVTVAEMTIPEQWPDGSFDLIVLSEVGYYLGARDLAHLVNRAVASLDPGGAIVAVHWRHPVADYPLGGDEVHAVLRTDSRLTPVVCHEEADFLLDVLVRPPVMSVAAAEGLVP